MRGEGKEGEEDLTNVFGARFSDEVLLTIASEQLLEAHIQRGKQLKLYPEDYNQFLEGRSASKQILNRWRLLRKRKIENIGTKKEKKKRMKNNSDQEKNDGDEEEEEEEEEDHLGGDDDDGGDNDEDEEDEEDLLQSSSRQKLSRSTSTRGKKRLRVDDQALHHQQQQQLHDLNQSSIVVSTSATISSSTMIVIDDQTLSFSSTSSASATFPVLPPLMSPNVNAMTPMAPSMMSNQAHSSHSPPAHQVSRPNTALTPSMNGGSSGIAINLEDEHHHSSRLSEEKELEAWARKILLPDLLEIQSIVRDAKIRQAANSSYTASSTNLTLQQQQSQSQQNGGANPGALALGIGSISPFSSSSPSPSIAHSFDIFEVLSRREGRLGHILSSHNEPRFIDPKTSLARNRDPLYKTVNAWHRARLHEMVDAPGIHGGIKKTLRWWGIKDKAVYPPGYSSLAAEAEERAMYQAAAEAERRRKIEEEILKERLRLEALRAEKRLQEEIAAKKERAEKERIEYEKRAALRERAEYEDRMMRERQEYEHEQRRVDTSNRYGVGDMDRGRGGRDSFAPPSDRWSGRHPPLLSGSGHNDSSRDYRDEGHHGGHRGGHHGGRWGAPHPPLPFRGSGSTAPLGGPLVSDFSRRRDANEAPLRRLDEDFTRRRDDRPLPPSSHSLHLPLPPHHLPAPPLGGGGGSGGGSLLGRPSSLPSQEVIIRDTGTHFIPLPPPPPPQDRPASLLGGTSSFNPNRAAGRFDRLPPPPLPLPSPPSVPHIALPVSRSSHSSREEGGGSGGGGGGNSHRSGKVLISDSDRAFGADKGINGRGRTEGGWR